MLATALFFILTENRNDRLSSLKAGGPTSVEDVADLIESAASAWSNSRAHLTATQ